MLTETRSADAATGDGDGVIPSDVWLMCAARGLSLFGNYLQYTALPLWVLATTGSAIATGLTFAVEILPVVVLAPWAGYFVDRFDRRTVLAVAEALSAAAVGVLLVATAHERLPLILAALMVIRVFDVFSMPASSAILKSRVPKAGLKRAVATSEALFGAVITAAPIIGTLAFGRFGIEALLVANLLSFVASSAITALLPPSPGSRNLTTVGAGLREAAQIVLHDRRLRPVALAEIGYFFCSGGITTLALVIAARSIGPDLTGVYLGGVGAGWLLCSLFVVRKYSSRPWTLLWVGLLGCTPVGLVLWKLIAINPVACFAGGLVAGSVNVLVVTAITVIFSDRVPAEAMGRVFAGRRATLNLALASSHVVLPAFAGAMSAGVTAMVAGLVTTVVCTTLLVPATLSRTSRPAALGIEPS